MTTEADDDQGFVFDTQEPWPVTTQASEQKDPFIPVQKSVSFCRFIFIALEVLVICAMTYVAK